MINYIVINLSDGYYSVITVMYKYYKPMDTVELCGEYYRILGYA